MATSLYDQPAQANILDTYVPINFDLIYRAASTQQAQIDRAVQDLSGNIRKWSEFRSPSVKDTESFYNLTLGALKQDIESLVANPDLMKTSAGRYALQSKINSIDYDKLSRLQQGSVNLQKRLENISDLQAKGLYNENWDDLNVSSYDTLNQGILSELSPITYMDYGQLTEPYTDIPTSYLEQRDPYSYWVGVSPEMLENTIGENFDQITRSPQAQMHLRDIQRQLQAQGIEATPEAVREVFIRNSVQSQQKRLSRNVEYDKAGLTRLEYSLRERANQAKKSAGESGSEVDSSYSYSPTEQLIASINKDQAIAAMNNPLFSEYGDAMQLNSAYQKQMLDDTLRQLEPYKVAYTAAIQKGDTETARNIANQMGAIQSQAGSAMDQANQQVRLVQEKTFELGMLAGLGYNNSGATLKNVIKEGVNSEVYYEEADKLLQNASAPAPTELTGKRFAQDYLEVTPSVPNAFGSKAYNVASSRQVVLASDVVSDIAGISNEDKPKAELLRKWNSGEIKNLQVIPIGTGYNYVDRNGEQHTLVSVEVYVPKDEMKKLDGAKNSKKFVNGEEVEGKENTDTGKSETYIKFRAYTPISNSSVGAYNYDRIVTKTYGGTSESQGDRDYQAETNF